jgi:Fur family transcriptional regulator, peroxide stress response regulator
MVNKEIVEILVENNLKVTPQRIAVLEVLQGNLDHPSAENILQYMRINHPNVPIGTVYKILDVFCKKGIVTKVKTDDNALRFDPVKEPHHHLYCSESDRIEDFYDDDLNELLANYLKKKKIPNFTVENVKLQIIGKFKINK